MRSSRSIVPVVALLGLLAGCGRSAPSPSGPVVLPDPAPLGPTYHEGGTTFRVWAPHADRVFVSGDFNGWATDVDELARGLDGVFGGEVAGAMPGDEYVYVIRRGADTINRLDPRSPRVTNSMGHSVIVDPSSFAWSDAAFTLPPPEDRVVYEMHIGTFNDTPGGAPGTWQSAIAKLDYLSTLGVNMLEVMPPAEFAGDFSWGYNPAFPFAPESAYGTPDDMKAFVDAAHARGMGVIVDVVHNHYGPQDLSMWCFDDECLGDGNGGIYFYADARRETGWGPRPDYGRDEIRQYVLDDTRMWLRDYHADGLRWDSTVSIRTAAGADNPDGWHLLQAMNDDADAVTAARPSMMIAEDLQNDPWLTRPTDEGGAGFDSQWDAGFFHPVDDTIINPSDAARSMPAIRDAITHVYDGHAFRRVVYTESHDEVANGRSRIPQMITPDDPGSFYARKRSTLGAAIALTSPGVPMLFEGQEFLEDGWFQDSVPLDWSKTTTWAGILQMYRDLIALRRNAAGTTAGLQGEHVDVFHVNDDAKVIAYRRWKNGGPGDDVIVLANFSNHAWATYDIGFPAGGVWKVRFNSDDKAYSADFDGAATTDIVASAPGMDGMGYRGRLVLGRYSLVILSQ